MLKELPVPEAGATACSPWQEQRPPKLASSLGLAWEMENQALMDPGPPQGLGITQLSPSGLPQLRLAQLPRDRLTKTWC